MLCAPPYLGCRSRHEHPTPCPEILPITPALPVGMNRPPSDRPTARAANAGALLVATALVLAAIGAGVGLLLDAPVAGAVIGGLIGFPAGIFVVRARFRDL